MGNKLVPKILLEGAPLTFKTECISVMPSRIRESRAASEPRPVCQPG